MNVIIDGVEYVPKIINENAKAICPTCFQHCVEWENSIIEIGHCKLDTLTREFFYKNKRFRLTNYEYRVVQCLMMNKGRVVERENLLAFVCGTRYYIENERINTRLADVYVGYLRKKTSYDIIESIRAFGYRFIGL